MLGWPRRFYLKQTLSTIVLLIGYHAASAQSRELDAFLSLRVIDSLDEAPGSTPIEQGANSPPTVEAGPDQFLHWPANNSVVLNATVSDDGLPTIPGILTRLWTRESGPGAVQFLPNSSVENPNVVFAAPGVYRLRLTVDDGEAFSFDTVIVNVLEEPLPVSIAHYTFDETSGTILNDQVGDNNGTLHNFDISNPADPDFPWVAGVHGGALQFDGINDYVSLSHEVITTTEFTITAWAFQEGPAGGLDGTNLIFAQRGDLSINNISTISLATEFTESDPYGFAFVRSSSGRHQWLLPPRMPYGQWHHYAMTVDDKDFVFYIDGVLVDQIAMNQLGNFHSAIDYVDIGRSRYDGMDFGFFNGMIDHLSIYNVALTQAQLKIINGFSNALPLVDAGRDHATGLRTPLPLNAAVTDDGLPLNPGLPDLTWSIESGPGSATFFPSDSVEDPIVTFDTAGTYVLQLTASDGEFIGIDSIVVNVSSDLMPAPIAHWPLEQNVNPTLAPDIAGNHDGTLLNFPTDGSAWVDGSLQFDGIDDYVSVSHAAELNESEFTVMFKANVSGGQGTYRAPVSNRAYDPLTRKRYGFVVYAGNDNLWQCWMGGATLSDNLDIIRGSVVELNTWTHVAVSFSRDAPPAARGTYTGTLSLYIDGTLDAQKDNVRFMPNSFTNFRMGNAHIDLTNTNGDFFFQGQIDDVRIYSYALPPSHIKLAAGLTMDINDDNIVNWTDFTLLFHIEQFDGIVYLIELAQDWLCQDCR